MLAKLFLLFTIIPIIELFVLIPLGGAIGVGPTIAIIVATGIIGAWLGKKQGLEAYRRIQEDLATGQLPGDAIMDGLLVLIACTLLVTPGVLTDAVGLTLLIPPARKPLKKWMRGRFTNMLQNPNVTVIDVGSSFGPRFDRRSRDEDVIDITPTTEERGEPSYTLVD
jgi:UPF0716 protein FxsA